jgi:hypothetical protein
MFAVLNGTGVEMPVLHGVEVRPCTPRPLATWHAIAWTHAPYWLSHCSTTLVRENGGSFSELSVLPNALTQSSKE